MNLQSHVMPLLLFEYHKGKYKCLSCIQLTCVNISSVELGTFIITLSKFASWRPPSPLPPLLPILWSALCLYSQHICNIRQSRAQTRGAAARRLVAWLRINLTAGDNGHLSRLPQSWLWWKHNIQRRSPTLKKWRKLVFKDLYVNTTCLNAVLVSMSKLRKPTVE